MINRDIQGSAYQFFIEEVPELLQNIESGILGLKTDKTTAKIHEIMRCAHSLKGGAASVELEGIKTIAHRLEDYFKALYSDTVVIDEELETLLLQGYDCIRVPLLQQINTGNYDESQALNQAEPIFSAIEARLGDALAHVDDYIPSSSDLGIDITASIFEVDVAQIITDLEKISNEQSQAELAAQIEIFASFGELLDLPGVRAIAETASTALRVNPQQIRQIIQSFQQDVQTSRELVLAGDRTNGGQPSPSLLSLASSTPRRVTLDDQAYQFFIEEAPELLIVMEAGILTLRDNKSINTIHEIMRAAHSLKGGAASVRLEGVKTIAHRLEDYFKALYSDTVIIDEELETLLLQGYDCIKIPLLEQISTGTYDEIQALTQAEPIFSAIEARLGDALAHIDDYIPSSSDLGIDMVQSIFEIDVQQELERLIAVIAHPKDYAVAGEARALIDVFAGFGELLNLPGFRLIAQTALNALENRPEQALHICELMLRDFSASREQVLAGDRTSGGEPSSELLSLSEGESLPLLEDVFTQSELETETSHLLEDLFALETETSSLLENVFESETETSPLLEDIFESETETSPLLEDVFASETETSPLLENVFESETETSPLLEDVFESEFESTSLLEDVFESEFESTSLLEDVFESETETSPLLEDVFASEFESTSLLEDVFTQSELVSEALSQAADKQETEAQEATIFDLTTNPSLEDIFGQIEITEKIAEPQKNLDTVVKSIEDIFENLPAETDFPITKHEPKEQLPPPVPPVKASTTTVSNLSVRIDLNRIERINNLIGELAINRNSLSLQNEQLQRTVKELLNRFSRFQAMNKKLREVSDQILISPFSQYGTLSEYSYVASDFDTLEMDSYGTIHGMLQGLLEEMIQLEEAVEDIALFSRQSNQSIEQQRQMLTRVRDELMWARMLPLSEVLNRFPRVLRDLSTTYQKQVKLKLTGTGVLIEKAALEKLYDPLIHLLRNAFDHGIEAPEMRVAHGKPKEGLIEIKAYHQGNRTIVEVSDDGQGINLDKIGKKILEKQLLSPEQVAVASREQLLDFIFTSGFSTAEQVSELSGRGVGLDVVHAQMQSLKGSITVNSSKGKGTTFTLSLPLTLTIAKLLVCLVGSTAVALPSDSIEEIIIPQTEQVKISGTQRFLQLGNQIIPAHNLRDLLPYNCPVTQTFDSKILLSVPIPEDWALPFLILRRGHQVYALEVDRLLTEQELVIKPFSSTIAPPSYAYGCTILGDGSLIPVINGAILLEMMVEREIAPNPVKISIPDGLNTVKTTTILVVDDSAAMRRTLALTLEKANYRILSAKDGREALDQLHKNSGINLVICDIEMPIMNGFEFLTQRRRDQEFLKIPVAMLTSRSNDKHRRLAMQLGADAYFTKPYIEQEFLKSIQQMITPTTPESLASTGNNYERK
ncbi:Hpt domain-containing protein [Gloeocapsa sp. PCC 73106]|uniref:hybrid sensor histidine kinase/response regulator n=1 Tax=Gloeocapsa sp. PCC 73106 TaxID=102232 RepID=UPI0002AB9E94|nr:Hpt domain-containing protein [Gloeocapsa sp. PCC 73106]ELR98793.1 chemotaxis protein histidine kinase-like protein [Gloeocapsa sp. PCC 73106]